MSTPSTAASGICCDLTTAGQQQSGGVWWRIVIGAFLAINSMTIALTVNLSEVDREQRLALQGVTLAVALVVFALLGSGMLSSAVRELRARRLTIECLFLLGIMGAFTASLVSLIRGEGPVFFEVVGILLVVYALGRELGRYSQAKVLQALRDWDPRANTCEVISADGSISHFSIADVQVGQRVRVHPGAVIPVDGTVIDGAAFVHEAGMTGESFAVSKQTGDTVFAGTHVVDTTLVVEATANGGERCIDGIAQILRRVEAQAALSQMTANRLVRWFVPTVVAIAAGTFIWHSLHSGWQDALFHSMAVLLVACPCALGFATPIAVWMTMGQLNRLGMLVRSGDAVERLAAVNLAVFDKTGTLTVPEAGIEFKIEPAFQDQEQLVRSLIATAESGSSHPLAKVLGTLSNEPVGQALSPANSPLGSIHFASPTLPKLSHERERVVYEPECFSTWRRENLQTRRLTTLPGKGIAAEVEDRSTSQRWSVEIVQDSSSKADAGNVLLIRINGAPAAQAELTEQQRPFLPEMKSKLETIDVSCVLLTGDRESRAEKLPFAHHARLKPQEKYELVRQWGREGKRILFVGDGVNDSAAMSQSHVSVAVDAAADLTREVADVYWPTPDFSQLPSAIALSRKMVRLIRSNLIFAVSYNLIGMALAACGSLHPVIAALLMTTSSCVVTFRAMLSLDGDNQETLPSGLKVRNA